MKTFLSILLSLLTTLVATAAPTKKIIDAGGSGPYKAVAVAEESLPGFVVYRPADIASASAAEGPLPLFIFANGGCNDTSLPYERMLNDIASHGYLVVALGEMQDSINDRPLNKSANEDMIHAVNWAEMQCADPQSPYHSQVALDKIAFGGHSCGGAMTLANCADERVKTCLMMNAGMGDIEMWGASRESLKALHCPILYLIGGDSDIAYDNAVLDYDRIDNVPVAFANHLKAGHGGTFHDQYGGSFGSLTRAWLDWHLNGKGPGKDIFLGNQVAQYPDYTFKAKNFPQCNEPYKVELIDCASRDGKKIWGKAYIPLGGEQRKPTVIMAHGYNGNHYEPQAFAETLAMRGIASYIFDFCGGSNSSKSDGATTEMTIFTEKDNLEDITRQVKALDFVDPERIGLLGCSQGGLVAALTSATNPQEYKAVVLVYPALGIPATAPMMLEKFDADGGRPQNVMGMMLGRCYYEKINGLDIIDLIDAYKGKVLIVYGDNDPVTAGGMMERAAAKYADCETKVIAGGTHGFGDYHHHEQASGAIADFIVRVLEF